jgi:hypothetical protein
MTPQGDVSLNVDQLSRQLYSYYGEITALIENNNNDDFEEIKSLILEASDLMQSFKTMVENDDNRQLYEKELMLHSQKISTLILLLKSEKLKMLEQISRVKNGRQALQAYRPIRSGMGYTSGKFVDSKK